MSEAMETLRRAAEVPEVRLCRDCRHCRPARPLWKCAREVNLVDGSPGYFCDLERHSVLERRCGAVGRFWEPKEPARPFWPEWLRRFFR